MTLVFVIDVVYDESSYRCMGPLENEVVEGSESKDLGAIVTVGSKTGVEGGGVGLIEELER